MYTLLSLFTQWVQFQEISMLLMSWSYKKIIKHKLKINEMHYNIQICDCKRNPFLSFLNKKSVIKHVQIKQQYAS